jgi:hypothetical protein
MYRRLRVWRELPDLVPEALGLGYFPVPLFQPTEQLCPLLPGEGLHPRLHALGRDDGTGPIAYSFVAALALSAEVTPRGRATSLVNRYPVADLQTRDSARSIRVRLTRPDAAHLAPIVGRIEYLAAYSPADRATVVLGGQIVADYVQPVLRRREAWVRLITPYDPAPLAEIAHPAVDLHHTRVRCPQLLARENGPDAF